MSDASTALSPQEWKWHLEDKGLIPRNNVELKLEPLTGKDHHFMFIAILLPPNATVVSDYKHADENDDVSTQVAQGLSWLHEATNHDLRLLQTALQEAQSLRNVLDKRVQLLTAHFASNQDCSHGVSSSDASNCGYKHDSRMRK